jgi:hypothetical protein
MGVGGLVWGAWVWGAWNGCWVLGACWVRRWGFGIYGGAFRWRARVKAFDLEFLDGSVVEGGCIIDGLGHLGV